MSGVGLKPSKLAHVVLLTNDVQNLRDWWMAALEAHVVYEERSVCFLTYDDEHHRIVLVNLGRVHAAHDPDRCGLYHVAFGLPSHEELYAHYEALTERSIMPYRCINHGPTTSMYYADPDGNNVEFQVENFATPAEATTYMRSPAFAKNPIGVEFEPSLERVLAGRKFDSGLARANGRPDH